MTRLIWVPILLAALAVVAVEAGDDNAAIISATKSYVAATSGMTKITVTVEQVADDFARVKVTPEDSKAADPAWVFLKKQDGKWTGLVLGTSLTTEDYQQLGIPNALRVP
jgi:hypothetical protein